MKIARPHPPAPHLSSLPRHLSVIYFSRNSPIWRQLIKLLKNYIYIFCLRLELRLPAITKHVSASVIPKDTRIIFRYLLHILSFFSTSYIRRFQHLIFALLEKQTNRLLCFTVSYGAKPCLLVNIDVILALQSDQIIYSKDPSSLNSFLS